MKHYFRDLLDDTRFALSVVREIALSFRIEIINWRINGMARRTARLTRRKAMLQKRIDRIVGL